MKQLVLISAILFSGIVGMAQRPQAISKGIISQHGGSSGYGGYNMGPPPMSAADFRMACDAIRRQPFDDDKLRIANQVLRGQNVTSLQVRDMAKLFTFEQTRMDFAKAAYTSVLDPQNFYVVNEAFTFSSSIAELAQYTNSVGYSGGNTWTNGYGGSNGSGHHGSGHGQGGGHNHPGACTPGCGGATYGQNGYYGGGQCGTTTYGSGNGMSYSGGMNTVPAIPMCGMCSGHHAVNIVCEREFASISGAICNRTFESDKILVAKQALGGKFVSADQVRRIMGLFTFESTKLEFAKWAYRNTWDQQNYYVVNDAFTFSSSIRELDQFIRRG